MAKGEFSAQIRQVGVRARSNSAAIARTPLRGSSVASSSMAAAQSLTAR